MPSADEPGTPRGRWLLRVLATVVPLTLAAVFVVVSRAHRPVYLVGEPGSGLKLLYDPELGWRNIANDHSVTYGEQLTTNSHGFRGPEVAKRKPPGTKRILIVGDSFAWGYSVADHEVFARLLEKRLESLPTRWEVINAGVSGWGTDQEYLHLMQEGFSFDPDVVVLALFLANDFDNNETSWMYERSKPVFLNLDLELANVPVPRPGEDAPRITTQANPVTLTATIVNRMAAACAARDCAFVPVWFGNYLEPNNEEYRETTRYFVSRLSGGAHVHPFDLDAAFAEVGATLDQLTLGGPDRHWNAEGHKITADLVWRHLEKSGLLR